MADPLEGITWLGHASFKISAPEGVIYIDPWRLKDPEPADLILITHEHHDHFSADDVEKTRDADTAFVVTAAVAAQLQGDVRTVKAGDTVEVKGVAIEVVPAYNLRKHFHPQSAGGIGFILIVRGRRVYHAGDTDAIPEMADIQADVVLLPVGGKYTMDASEAARVANAIKPKMAVPMHWGAGVIGTRADAERFCALCEVPTKILEPEEYRAATS
ncbi:MAG TPA: MBL fold metallo-hydrolase [Anaerolineae bacterium]|nr:MBL fold metallo-hydrolase [Anaerolineae bacterium]